MSDFIINIAAVMRAEIQGLDAIAQNTANANTPGYKSQTAVLENTNFLANVIGNGSHVSPKTHTTLTAGNLNVTNRPLDFAAMEDSWFVVRSGNQLLLTKNGHFSLLTDGLLVNSRGDAVQGPNGDIYLGSEEVFIADNAIVEKDTKSIHPLLFAIPEQNAQVTPIGDGVYQVSRYQSLQETQNIIQGALEQSNVSVADDIVKMMETTRHIESLQRAIITYNDMLDVGINQLGK